MRRDACTTGASQRLSNRMKKAAQKTCGVAVSLARAEHVGVEPTLLALAVYPAPALSPTPHRGANLVIIKTKKGMLQGVHVGGNVFCFGGAFAKILRKTIQSGVLEFCRHMMSIPISQQCRTRVGVSWSLSFPSRGGDMLSGHAPESSWTSNEV